MSCQTQKGKQGGLEIDLRAAYLLSFGFRIYPRSSGDIDVHFDFGGGLVSSFEAGGKFVQEVPATHPPRSAQLTIIGGQIKGVIGIGGETSVTFTPDTKHPGEYKIFPSGELSADTGAVEFTADTDRGFGAKAGGFKTGVRASATS